MLLSPRQRKQLIRLQFINDRSKAVANNLFNLHMEHLNCTVKTVIGHQGSNFIDHAEKCAGPIINVLCKQFDSISAIRKTHPGIT